MATNETATASATSKPAANTSTMNPGDQAEPGTPGTGEAVCDNCKGSGKINGQDCPLCGGTGKVIEGIGGG